MKATTYFIRGLILLLAAVLPAGLTWAAVSSTLLWLWANKLTAQLDIVAPSIIGLYSLTIFVPLYGYFATKLEQLLLPDKHID